MTATETATRSCKGCANYRPASASPSAVQRYEAYLADKAAFEAQQAEKNKPQGFWSALNSIVTGPHWAYNIAPYPVGNPDTYGWCCLDPAAVKKRADDWCSHYTPSHGREGAE